MTSSSHTTYKHPPITEAIIDFQFSLPEETPTTKLESIYKDLQERYPTKEKLNYSRGHFEINTDGGTSSIQSEHIGYKFTSKDRMFIFQCRRDGFTLSRLAPYKDWDNLEMEAKDLWQRFLLIVKPIVTRIAVRYINRIDIPSLQDNFEDYFRTLPKLSGELPQQLSKFFMQLEIPQKEIAGRALITQTSLPQSNEDTISVILDIDIFQEDNITADINIWKACSEMRKLKNTIFRACITSKTEELFS